MNSPAIVGLNASEPPAEAKSTAKQDDCWGCSKHKETGMPGFIQVGCDECTFREIMAGPEVRAVDARPYELTKLLERMFPVKSEQNKWRTRIWAEIKRQREIA